MIVLGQDLARGLKIFLLEKCSTESASTESIWLDVKSSAIFSSFCFVVKAFAFQRLKFRLYSNIMAYFIQECRKGITNFIVLDAGVSFLNLIDSIPNQLNFLYFFHVIRSSTLKFQGFLSRRNNEGRV